MDSLEMFKIASIEAVRKKQYWQMLKRLYGGTDEAIESLKKSRDFNIYHGTREKYVKDIAENGLNPGPYREFGKGTFFGDKNTAGYYSKTKVIDKSRVDDKYPIYMGGFDRMTDDKIEDYLKQHPEYVGVKGANIRFARPSELEGSKLKYPNTNNAMVFDINKDRGYASAGGHLNYQMDDDAALRYRKILTKRYKNLSQDELINMRRDFLKNHVKWSDDKIEEDIERMKDWPHSLNATYAASDTIRKMVESRYIPKNEKEFNAMKYYGQTRRGRMFDKIAPKGERNEFFFKDMTISPELLREESGKVLTPKKIDSNNSKINMPKFEPHKTEPHKTEPHKTEPHKTEPQLDRDSEANSPSYKPRFNKKLAISLGAAAGTAGGIGLFNHTKNKRRKKDMNKTASVDINEDLKELLKLELDNNEITQAQHDQILSNYYKNTLAKTASEILDDMVKEAATKKKKDPGKIDDVDDRLKEPLRDVGSAILGAMAGGPVGSSIAGANFKRKAKGALAINGKIDPVLELSRAKELGSKRGALLGAAGMYFGLPVANLVHDHKKLMGEKPHKEDYAKVLGAKAAQLGMIAGMTNKMKNKQVGQALSRASLMSSVGLPMAVNSHVLPKQEYNKEMKEKAAAEVLDEMVKEAGVKDGLKNYVDLMTGSKKSRIQDQMDLSRSAVRDSYRNFKSNLGDKIKAQKEIEKLKNPDIGKYYDKAEDQLINEHSISNDYERASLHRKGLNPNDAKYSQPTLEEILERARILKRDDINDAQYAFNNAKNRTDSNKTMFKKWKNDYKNHSANYEKAVKDTKAAQYGTAAGVVGLAGAGIAAKKIHDKKKQVREDAAVRELEELANKSASEILDEMVKEAASASDILQTEKVKNKEPNPKTFSGRLSQPENFAYNTNVRNKMKVILDDKDNDMPVRYETNANGMGRRNQFLEAVNHYKDIPEFHRKDEGIEDYRKRRDENVKKSMGPKKFGKIMGNILHAGTTAGMVGMGKNAPAAEKAYLAAAGALIGFAPNMIARHMGDKATQKKYLNSLKPEERETLMNLKKQDAETVSQHARKADTLKMTNYYAY